MKFRNSSTRTQGFARTTYEPPPLAHSNTYPMRGSWNFCQGGGGSRPDCQKTALMFFCFVFSPQLILQFYRGCPMVISKKTI